MQPGEKAQSTAWRWRTTTLGSTAAGHRPKVRLDDVRSLFRHVTVEGKRRAEEDTWRMSRSPVPQIRTTT